MLVNFQKREMVYKVLQEILLYQQCPYSFPALEPAKTFLSAFPVLSEKESYDLSLAYEPRNADPKSIS